MEWLSIVMFAVMLFMLAFGYPVALTIAGVSLSFAGIGLAVGAFDVSILQAIALRIYGIMTNESLIAVPTFIFMGITLQKAKIAEDLLDTMTLLFGGIRGGLAFSVVIVGGLLAAATGIVGATVITMGLLSLPVMLKRGYDPALSCGVICASGTLGQIIPPSIVLIILGDVINNTYGDAQREIGNWSADTVSVNDMFAGALIPGLMLVGLYILYVAGRAFFTPNSMPLLSKEERIEQRGEKFWLRLIFVLCPPLLLILAVLGSIFAGLATPTEAASVGAFGALVIAFIRYWFDKKHHIPANLHWLIEVPRETLIMTSMVFFILIGATLFSLVFRAYGGEHIVENALTNLPGGEAGALLVVMLVIFLLGFVLDFTEIVFVVIPIVAPILFKMDIDPVWFGILVAMNLQTGFLTPPFGFALFFLRGVAPASVPTSAIYRGVVPFILIQLLMLGILAFFPSMVHWVKF